MEVPEEEAETAVEDSATVDRPDATCLPREECNGIDDDCDGLVDEDFDLSTDIHHCGACNVPCVTPHAVPECDGGRCSIGECDEGYYDINRVVSDGCEYACAPEAGWETMCSDYRDNDCDGRVDYEDPDCGDDCLIEALHEIDDMCWDGRDNDCDERVDFDDPDCGGWCEPAPDPSEYVCDGIDNDCDGYVDEDYVPFWCGTGACGRESTCYRGEEECIPGAPEPEVCDGIDNDCDGSTDEVGCGGTIGVQLVYGPNSDVYERYHTVVLDCQSSRNSNLYVTSGCTSTDCDRGERCGLGTGTGVVSHDFTVGGPGPFYVCYFPSSPAGYTWDAQIFIDEGGSWVLWASGSDVTGENWLCTYPVSP
jgi:hypothetical protein